ncbi:MAG: carbohydrate ABC transporter permease [Clostridia bacterium]|nr:carbohydrate ABC transporter permease [Clostridia bacterium]MBQ3461641.1 carbohydrate ABC transporter permease [Clostridia bacterium]MBQ9598728.1 carbohydrate ABC transporter permease [Clostridia bacterium]MBR0027332.1 carbohydrate ABC transporter permease [Clostridia bacterium]MBR0470283.1 carbohydrate ABC transporter permease [Clostridia bacterium]
MVKDNSISSKVLDIIIYVSLIFLMIIILYPIIYIFSVSVSSTTAYESGRVIFLPVEFNLEAYKIIFEAGTIPRSFVNSVLYTVVYVVVSLLFTTTMAYPLSRSKDRVPFKGLISKIVIFTMFFNAGTIPNFILVKNLGLMNSMWSLILPIAVSTYNLVVMRSFFEGIPSSLEEAAFVDGANEIQIFFKIMLPLAKAALATVGLFYGVAMWNSWFTAMLYLQSESKYPLQLIIRHIVMQNQMQAELAAMGDTTAMENATSTEALKYATLFLSILPMLAVYPFIQKYFVKGVMVGSVKG